MFGSAKTQDHRPADPVAARKLVSGLPSGDPFRPLQQIAAWLETLTAMPEVRLDRRFEAIGIFEEAARPLEARIARDYVLSGRLQSAHEHRLWTAAHDFWHQLAVAYHLSMMEFEAGSVGASGMYRQAPIIACRAMRALRHELKWVLLRYGPAESRLWQEAARIYQLADTKSFAQDRTALQLGDTSGSTVEQEFIKMLLLGVSSVNSLAPPQLEIADRIVSRCAEFVGLDTAPHSNSTHAFDLAKSRPPRRAVNTAGGPTIRFLAATSALPHMEKIVKAMIAPEAVPPYVDEGWSHDPRAVREVAHHLALYWSARPPTRGSERNATMARVSVVPGFQGLLEALQGLVGGPFVDDTTESWMAENVSRGGYGALFPRVRGDWLRVGGLVGIKPEAAPLWGVGVVRRITRDENKQCHVGIESLAKAAIPVRLLVSGSADTMDPATNSYDANAALLTMSLANAGDMNVLMEAGSYSPRLPLEVTVKGATYVLTPVGFVEGGDDFDVARYKIVRRD